MPQSGETALSANAVGNSRSGQGSLGLNPRWILLQLGALMLLAIGTIWLLQRGERRHTAAEFTGRGRAVTELVAMAMGPDITFDDSARFLRTLERAGRNANLAAGALLDSTGTVIAHTNVARTRVRLDGLPLAIEGAQQDVVRSQLFGGQTGRLFLHPLIGDAGHIGHVALLIAPPGGSIFGSESLKLLIPAALLVLAFIGLTIATVRQAIRPAEDFLRRLSITLQQAGAQEQPQDRGQFDVALERTVSSVNALNDAKDTLTIENRTLDYERRKRELVLDHLPEGLVMTDAAEKIILINRAAATAYGLNVQQAHGHQLGALGGPAAELLRHAQRSGQAQGELTPEGRQTLLAQVQRIPLSPGGAGGSGVLYMLRDVSAQQAAMRAQGEFLSQVSHELKAPLNSILAYVEALADDDLLSQDDRREFSNSLTTEAQRMARLITNLLQLSRIQLGSLSGRFGFVKTTDLIGDLAASLRTQAEDAGQTFAIEVPDNLPALHGDKDLLGVAITNLITNAFKYTPAGGRVKLCAAVDDNAIVIEISDTGFGITPEDQAHIFERFYRSNQSEVRQHNGSGLGLSLVAEIAELHDGAISVESHHGEGSTFRLRLPGRAVGERLDIAA